MGKMATKKAVDELNKILGFLGDKGGQIETNDPGTWWTLDVDVQNSENIVIGIFEEQNGDLVYDPKFELNVKRDGDRVTEVEIMGYESTTMFGTLQIDENDMIVDQGDMVGAFNAMFGTSYPSGPSVGEEKDEYGLKKRFSSFMENMVEVGPYLTKPKSVKKY